MRHSIIALTVLVAAAGSAGAGDRPAGKDKSPSEGAGPSREGAGATSPGENRLLLNNEPGAYGERWGGLLDIRRAPKGAPKPWEVGAVFETHVLVRQNDLEGAGSNKLMNEMFFYAFADITRNNRVSLRGGFTNHHFADEQETGYRLTDMSLSYTRFFPLPHEFLISAKASLTAPTSFHSQKMSLYTAPSISLGVSKRLGHLSADARIFGTTYIVKYASSEGGNANPQWELGGYLEVEYSMPFHEQLVVGADGYTEYSWLYDVHNGASSPTGTTVDPQFPHQPATQVYGGEIFVRYAFPVFAGIHTDLTVAFANGDPALGYNSVLHDGVAHTYAFWRLNSEFYGALSARY